MMDKIKKAWGVSAKSAGNKTANKASAVMMRCLSIESTCDQRRVGDSMHEARNMAH
jgi:hypothetical protein